VPVGGLVGERKRTESKEGNVTGDTLNRAKLTPTEKKKVGGKEGGEKSVPLHKVLAFNKKKWPKNWGKEKERARGGLPITKCLPQRVSGPKNGPGRKKSREKANAGKREGRGKESEKHGEAPSKPFDRKGSSHGRQKKKQRGKKKKEDLNSSRNLEQWRGGPR